MGMLDIHEAALKRSVVAYHRFLLHYRSSARAVYGFVEGKDDPSFYRGKIESYLPDEWDISAYTSWKKGQSA